MAAAALGLWIPVILRHLPSIMRAVHDLYATWCTMRGTSHNNSVVLKAMKLLMKHQNNLDTLLQNPNEKKQVLEGLTILINRINQSGGGGGGGGNGGGGNGGYGARALPPPPLPSAPSPEYPSKDRRWRVCDVCLSEYNFTDKKPMILFCGHTFCRECLKEVFSQNNKCPTCRQRDTRSFSALPPNVELLRMLEDEEWNKEDEDLKKNGEKSGCISGGCDGGCGDGGGGDDGIPLSFEDQIQFAIFLSTQTAQTRGHEFVEAKWKEIECEEDEMLAQALQLSEVYEISQACSTQRREGECVRGNDDDDGDGGDCALNQQSECAQRKQSNCAMNQESNCAEREENDCPKSQQSECAQREQDKTDLNQSDNEEEQEEEGGEGAAAAPPPPGAAAAAAAAAAASRYEEEEASLRLALELHFEEIALNDKLNGCAGGGGGGGCDGTTEPTSDWIEQYHRYLGSCSYHTGEDDLDESKMDERNEEKGGEDEGRNIDAKEEEEKEEAEAPLICGGRDEEEEEEEPMKCYEEEDEKRKTKNNNNNCGEGGGGGEESGNQCIESENDCDDDDGDGVASLCCRGEEEWKKKKKCNGEEDDPLEEKRSKEQFSKMMREQEEALIEMALQMSLKDLHNGPKEEEE